MKEERTSSRGSRVIWPFYPTEFQVTNDPMSVTMTMANQEGTVHIGRRTGTLPLLGFLIVAALGVSYGVGAASSPHAFAAGTGADCQPSSSPIASVDTALDNDISSQVGPGWIAGDAGYSTALPNGNEAFVFSDTVIGTAQTNGTATFTGLPNNSELVGALNALKSDYGGTYAAPGNLISDANGSSDEWQTASTYTVGSKQLIFVNEFAVIPGNFFDQYTGNSAIVTMSIPSTGSQLPVYSSITPIPADATTQWGNAMTSTSTYDYVYGFALSGMKLARIPVGETLIPSDWRYWNGSSWVSGEAHATIIQTTNEFTGVSKSSSGGYMALSIPNSVSTDKSIFASYACAPQGPWTTPVAFYTIPEVSSTGYANEIAYMANEHPEIKSTNGLVVSYSINTTDGLPALAANIHEYQPRFLLVNPGSSGGGSTTTTTTAPPPVTCAPAAEHSTPQPTAIAAIRAANGCPGYWVVNASGNVSAFGNAPNLGGLNGSVASPVIDVIATPGGNGYWLVTANGTVRAFGDAGSFGDMSGHQLNGGIVAMAATPDGGGYWLVGSDGGIFSFGDAQFYGSTGAMHLNQPVAGIGATPDGAGYWLVAADGGIFSFGDAQFLGSMGATPLNKPVVGMTADPAGRGYRMVAADGGIFSFGAPFFGSLGANPPAAPIVNMAPSTDGNGYYMLDAGGGVYSFGDAPFLGAAS
jgi:hypothetical protein